MIPLAGQVGGQPLLGMMGLASHNAVHRVNHRCEVLPHFQTVLEILVLLFLLVLFQNFFKFLLPVGAVFRVRNSRVEFGCTAAFPELVAAGIAPFLSGGGWMCVCVFLSSGYSELLLA